MASPVINSTQVLRFRGPEELPGLRAEKGPSFDDIFKKTLNDASDMQAESQRLIEAFVRGEPVEIHEVMAAANEAAISLELLVEIRNKLTEAYRTVMNMQ
jgi:flagellar hook-basal body complex protein FliE